jgi:hypothetical protein
MARSKVVQVPCDAELYAKIAAYRNSKGLDKDAAAARQLIIFALRVLENSDKDEGISTRDLLEVLLDNVVKIHHQTSINYYQNFNEAQYNANMKVEDVIPSYKRLMTKAEERTKLILDGGAE